MAEVSTASGEAPPYDPRAASGPVHAGRQLYYRHKLPVRLLHWVNVVVIAIMLMSGLQIFNAHPALYWGQAADFFHPVLWLHAEQKPDGSLRGVTQIGGHDFTTTGVLGASDYQGQQVERGFPAWITLPSSQWLAMGRRWHLFFAWLFAANGALFVGYAIWSGHFRRELLPTGKDIGHLPAEIADHARLRFPKGEAAKHYNALQKLTYFLVIFGLGPLIVITGLTMSPAIDTAFPILPWIFGGRQSARTIHFLCAFGFVLFFIVHILMVVLSGPWNNLRAIVTGRYAIKRSGGA